MRSHKSTGIIKTCEMIVPSESFNMKFKDPHLCSCRCRRNLQGFRSPVLGLTLVNIFHKRPPNNLQYNFLFLAVNPFQKDKIPRMQTWCLMHSLRKVPDIFFLKLKKDSVTFEQMCIHSLTQLEVLRVKQFRGKKNLAFVTVVVLSLNKTLASPCAYISLQCFQVSHFVL